MKILILLSLFMGTVLAESTSDFHSVRNVLEQIPSDKYRGIELVDIGIYMREHTAPDFKYDLLYEYGYVLAGKTNKDHKIEGILRYLNGIAKPTNAQFVAIGFSHYFDWGYYKPEDALAMVAKLIKQEELRLVLYRGIVCSFTIEYNGDFNKLKIVLDPIPQAFRDRMGDGIGAGLVRLSNIKSLDTEMLRKTLDTVPINYRTSVFKHMGFLIAAHHLDDSFSVVDNQFKTFPGELYADLLFGYVVMNSFVEKGKLLETQKNKKTTVDEDLEAIAKNLKFPAQVTSKYGKTIEAALAYIGTNWRHSP